MRLFDPNLRYWRLLLHRITPEPFTVAVFDSIARRGDVESLMAAIRAVEKLTKMLRVIPVMSKRTNSTSPIISMPLIYCSSCAMAQRIQSVSELDMQDELSSHNCDISLE